MTIDGRILRKAMNDYLRAHRLCERCLTDGIRRPAIGVMTVAPLDGSDALMMDLRNWISVCKQCADVMARQTEIRFKCRESHLHRLKVQEQERREREWKERYPRDGVISRERWAMIRERRKLMRKTLPAFVLMMQTA